MLCAGVKCQYMLYKNSTPQRSCKLILVNIELWLNTQTMTALELSTFFGTSGNVSAVPQGLVVLKTVKYCTDAGVCSSLYSALFNRSIFCLE